MEQRASLGNGASLKGFSNSETAQAAQRAARVPVLHSKNARCWHLHGAWGAGRWELCLRDFTGKDSRDCDLKTWKRSYTSLY